MKLFKASTIGDLMPRCVQKANAAGEAWNQKQKSRSLTGKQKACAKRRQQEAVRRYRQF